MSGQLLSHVMHEPSPHSRSAAAHLCLSGHSFASATQLPSAHVMVANLPSALVVLHAFFQTMRPPAASVASVSHTSKLEHSCL